MASDETKRRAEMADEQETTESEETDKSTETETKALTPEESNRLREQVRKANSEAAKYRRRAEDADKKDQEREAAKLSDTEKKDAEVKRLAEENAKLNGKLRKTTLRHATESEAITQGFEYPDAAYRLIDLDEVEFDEDGEPDRKAIKKALKDLAEEKPKLLKATADTDSRDKDKPERRSPKRDKDISDVDSRSAKEKADDAFRRSRPKPSM